jgi:hypothetical protein
VNTISIGTLQLSVAVQAQPGLALSLELFGDGLRAWEDGCHRLQGDLYPYAFDAGSTFAAINGDRRLAGMPHFADVFKFVAEQHAANRANPIGAFLRPAVVAMETSLAEATGSSVYFARSGDRIKIGWSRQVATRLAQLQTGNAAPIELLGVVPGGRSAERELHSRFAADRVSGEWFEASPELLAHITAACTP